jgi:predicted enzyme related to lactoylglutathione lyase
VNDVDITAQKVEAAGGKILMPKTAIPGVGWLIKFQDTEGNLACAINFDASAK